MNTNATRIPIVLALVAGVGTAVPAADPPRDSASVSQAIDRRIEQKLAAVGAKPASRADDADFLRRVCLDITGKIPARARTRAFLDDTDAEKRRKLIDELLSEPAYGQHFARLWRDRLASEESNRREPLANWLAEAFNANRGWDAVVTDLITAEGNTPQAAFVYNHLDDGQPRPNRLAAAAARLFLGNQLQCAECHDHPYAEWKQTDLWGLAAFFARTYIRGTDPKGVQEQPGGPPKTRFGPPPLKLAADGSITIPEDAGPGAGQVVAARLLGTEPPPVTADGALRPMLARWVTAPDNPYFAQATVNRLWGHFFGRGFVNPIDDLHAGNPPSHPELMAVLSREFRASDHDLKHLIRCICNSAAYQRTARHVGGTSGEDDAQLTHFGRMRPRVLNADALHDSLLTAAGIARVGKGSLTRGEFTRLFSTRGVDDDPADFSAGIPQVLALMNDKWFNSPPELVAGLVRAKAAPTAAVEEVYLATLNRRPRETERNTMLEYLQRRADLTRGLTGVWWILLNSGEFVLIP